ncbi:Uncharacterised protein [Moraxella caprae]|uniref:Uncharacterized protein n=2 Tax=Moraxella TaxID=475 RepID=A0A378QZG6_9GAMM|nr:Uncharacterised protein [Moraxella bovis]STZ08466.1 Uncharacterised protein [Moraxella caprae]
MIKSESLMNDKTKNHAKSMVFRTVYDFKNH